jgi:hypothetical protein
MPVPRSMGYTPMPLALNSQDSQSPPGMTLLSDSTLGQWAKPTGIYVAPGVDFDKGVVNVVLWLHGWFVNDIEKFFKGDRSKVREQVWSSGKNVVLVAPYLGLGYKGGGNYSVKDLQGRWGETYLNQVLGSLAIMRDPSTYTPPWKRKDMSIVGAATSPGLRLGKLVIACHSGGGEGMRNLAAALGGYKGNLAECWGFDCLYHANPNLPPDDANFWYDWVSKGGCPVYISYGASTVSQSVKLDLMAQGLATKDGARRDPEGPAVNGVTVELGVPAARSIDALMGLDDILESERPPALGNKFAEQMANNVSRNVGWPADLMEMHYRIARDGLLSRLKGASFL